MKSTGESEGETAKCLIRAFYNWFEESFTAVAISDKKMYAIAVNEMISEAHSNTKIY
jgi:hypothetical protein